MEWGGSETNRLGQQAVLSRFMLLPQRQLWRAKHHRRFIAVANALLILFDGHAFVVTHDFGILKFELGRTVRRCRI